MTNAAPKGKFVWYDLMTTDPDAAEEFYTSLMGWGTHEWEQDDSQYTMWTVDGNPIGGVTALPDDAKEAGAPPHWLGYVATPDVDATVKEAQAAGASVRVPGTDIPEIGRFAILADPQDATFAVFSPSGESQSPNGPPGPGQFSWPELATADLEAGWKFYKGLFGWSVTEDNDMGEMGVYRMYGRGDGPMGGMFTRPPEMPMSAWLYYVTVEDLDSTVRKAKELGGQVVNGPMEVPGGDWIAQCMDPQGGMFALHMTKK